MRRIINVCGVLFVSLVTAAAQDPYSDPMLRLIDIVTSGDTNALQTMIKKGVNLNDRFGSKNQTLLHRAAYWGRLDSARLLIESGADHLAKDKSGNIAFHYAVMGNHLNVAQYLFAKGGQIDATNLFGKTSLELAAKEGAEEVALWLLEQGADPNIHGTAGGEKLVYDAQHKGKAALAKALLKRGVKATGKVSFQGWTPLHLSVMQGDANAVRAILKSGCVVDELDERRYTPLLLGIHQGQGSQSEIIDLLIEAGADIRKKDAAGKTAVEIAEKRLNKLEREEFNSKGNHEKSVREARATLLKVKSHYEKGESARGQTNSPPRATT